MVYSANDIKRSDSFVEIGYYADDTCKPGADGKCPSGYALFPNGVCKKSNKKAITKPTEGDAKTK